MPSVSALGLNAPHLDPFFYTPCAWPFGSHRDIPRPGIVISLVPETESSWAGPWDPVATTTPLQSHLHNLNHQEEQSPEPQSYSLEPPPHLCHALTSELSTPPTHSQGLSKSDTIHEHI